MIYLLAAIGCSSVISIIMRYSERFVRNNMVMFTTNYAICLALSRIYMGKINLFTTEEGIGTAVMLGVISGILYLTTFVLMQKNIYQNGIMLSSLFGKLGILVPTLMAVFVFHEQPKLMQMFGVAIAIAAILLINLERGGIKKGGRRILLLVQLLSAGITDSMANIYDKTGSNSLKDHYLFYIFLVAMILAFFMILVRKQHLTIKDVFFGIMIGVPNYFSSRFLLLAVGRLPAVIAYPVFSVGTLLVITAASVILFKEKLSNQKKSALILIIGALIMLNL